MPTLHPSHPVVADLDAADAAWLPALTIADPAELERQMLTRLGQRRTLLADCLEDYAILSLAARSLR